MNTSPSRITRACFALFAFSGFALSGVSVRADSSTVATGEMGSRAATEVKTLLLTWHDSARDRDVPVKIYYPVASAAVPVVAVEPCPVIVFSHGLGGSREGYAYLGEHWAAHGYVSVHVQHAGSDDALWRDEKRKLAALRALRGAASDPEAINARPLDVRFVIDRLTALAADTSFELHGRLDLARVGVAGHSFGAFTTMAVAGKAYAQGGAATARWADTRVKAAVAMSTPAPARRGKEPSSAGYEAVGIPVFHLTGTEDTDPAGGATDPAQRRIPYDHTTAAPAWLLTLEGGDHMVFGGPMQGDGRGERMKAKRTDRSRDPEFHALIQKATTAFWDAQLKDDKKPAPGSTTAAWRRRPPAWPNWSTKRRNGLRARILSRAESSARSSDASPARCRGGSRRRRHGCRSSFPIQYPSPPRCGARSCRCSGIRRGQAGRSPPSG